jgi:ATP-dependent Clp protease ATP-binding subunit ClpX
MIRANAANPRDRELFQDFIRDLEATPPQQLDRALQALGYRGQDPARQALCLLAYRHIRRVLRLHRDQAPAESLTAKFNYLLMGPTGSGKTHLTELLFNRVLRIPSVTVDITAYSETGYVGQDPSSMLTRLLHASQNNPLLASIGVICIDEFDKLSSGANNAMFAGAGTTKDVTGRGVQRELLKMLEGADVEVSTELTHSSYAERIVLSTRNITFIACGAFSGFKTLIAADNGNLSIGFDRDQQASSPEAIAARFTQDEVERTAYFQRYGFMPELIARFTRVVPFAPLDEDTLIRILEDNVIQGFVSEFASEGVDLEISAEVKRLIVHENLRKETGARGLSSILTRHLEKVAFTLFGQPSPRRHRVRLMIQGGDITCDMG